jgi:hypothetical protein
VDIAVSNGDAYWLSRNGDVYAQTSDPSRPTQLAPGRYAFSASIAVFQNSVYFGSGFTNGDHVCTVSSSGENLLCLPANEDADAGQLLMGGLAVDSSGVYWGSGPLVHHAHLVGGIWKTETIAVGLGNVMDLVINQDAIYWTEDTSVQSYIPGRVMGLAKPVVR